MEKDKTISLPDKIVEITNSLQPNSLNEIREKLLVLINEFINKDFQALIQLLYRIDVSEKKIRVYLNEKSKEDSASVLADLIIERQLQKIESRKKFRSKNNNENDEEKW
jgi:hypothetical protein